MENNLLQKLTNYYDEMVDIRRHLHKHPELSFQEIKTPKFIADYHQRLGLEVRTGVGERGVIATLRGKLPGKTVALRADFDALPIQEETGLPFKSTVPGVMHACGHDGHTASVLILAKALTEMKDELAGNIVFIHQHAEELPPGGAKAMIDDGCLDGVDVIFGNHLDATEPLGQIGYRKGAMMAAVDRFDITIKGNGGHGAQPHLTKDAIYVGTQIINSIQQIVSRNVNPLSAAVVSVGSFESINAFNVIANEAKISGTVRSFDQGVRDFIESRMREIIKGICIATGADYELSYMNGYPAVINHEVETDLVIAAAQKINEVTNIKEQEPRMGAEDFAYYLQHRKGTFFYTGAKAPGVDEVYPHHHPKFYFDEKALLIASKTLGLAALAYLDANT